MDISWGNNFIEWHDKSLNILTKFIKEVKNNKDKCPTVKMSDLNDDDTISINEETCLPFSSTLRKSDLFVLPEITDEEISAVTEKTKSDNISENTISENNTNTAELSRTESEISLNKHLENEVEVQKPIETERKLVQLKLIIPDNSFNIKVENTTEKNDLTEKPVDSKPESFNSSDTNPKILDEASPRTAEKPKMRPNKPKRKDLVLKKLQDEFSKQDDSKVVHEIVYHKYDDTLKEYATRSIERSFQRRKSRISFFDEMDLSESGSCPPSPINAEEQSPSFETNFYINCFNFESSCSTKKSSISSEDNLNNNRNSYNFESAGSSSSEKSSEKPTCVEENLKDDRRNSGFSFIYSTDDGNCESSMENNSCVQTSLATTSSLENMNNTCSDFNATSFLKNALGELTSKDTSLDLSFIKNSKNRSNSVGTSDISMLLSKASTVYNSMKNKLKSRRFSTTSRIDIENCEENNLVVKHFIKEIGIQHEIMMQTTKALNYCKSTKEFASSIERIEAERILLIASCTKEALSNEMNQHEYDQNCNSNVTQNFGTVTISELVFPSKTERKLEDNHRDFTEHFVIVLTSGKKVLASHIIKANEKGEILVGKSFTFNKLSNDFCINLCIYSMRVKNGMRNYSHESKYHINKGRRASCPSPKRMFSLYSSKNKLVDDVHHMKPSSFTLWGKYDINIQDLQHKKSEFRMYSTPLCSSLAGTFSGNIEKEILLENRSNGFLNLSVDTVNGCPTWNRRWCSLEGYNLKYWNSPSDEQISEPLGVLDLRQCKSYNVSVAERSICAKSKTLLLVLENKNSVKNYFLSADNFADMKHWQTEINIVLQSLRAWS